LGAIGLSSWLLRSAPRSIVQPFSDGIDGHAFLDAERVGLIT
jgi:hypothetical protein